MKRTQSGKLTIRGHTVRPEDMRKGTPDPVVYEWTDPKIIDDRKLHRLLCDAGRKGFCVKCESISHCQYGRELLKREAGKNENCL